MAVPSGTLSAWANYWRNEPVPSAGQKYLFASPTGSPTVSRADNSIDTPATVAQLLATMQPGDVGYLRAGTHTIIQTSFAAKNDGSLADPYHLLSYPGEWAILDGGHGGTGNYRSVLHTGNNEEDEPVYYWNFRRLEITGGGASDATSVTGAGIWIDARHCTFRHLYIHDNYASTVNAGAAGGLVLKTGSQDNVVEYCWLRCNGNPIGDVNTGNANLAIYSEYTDNAGVKDLTRATARNVVRFNRFDATGDAGWTPTAIVHKGFQRFTGYVYGETENVLDALPNGTLYRAYGDDLHHNLIVGHAQGLRVDKDYTQVHHNVLDISLNGNGSSGFAAIRTRDAYSTRRGSFAPCVYNNTIYAGGGMGLILTLIKDGWDGSVDGTTCPYDGGWAPNNLIVEADSGSDWRALSINSANSANCTGVQPYDPTLWHLSRNAFYNCDDQTDVIRFERDAGNMTIAEAITAGALDVAWALSSSPFAGDSGADKYKVTGSYALDGTYTMANGGLGGTHPYLGIGLPGYVGAIDPANDDWFDVVYALNSVTNLTRETV